jgi:CDGSH-type Zn-finger protein
MKEEKPTETIIEVIENGPLKITGFINITDPVRGIKLECAEIYLCRCGHSSNKPYCDESHLKKLNL